MIRVTINRPGIGKSIVDIDSHVDAMRHAGELLQIISGYDPARVISLSKPGSTEHVWRVLDKTGAEVFIDVTEECRHPWAVSA